MYALMIAVCHLQILVHSSLTTRAGEICKLCAGHDKKLGNEEVKLII